MPRVLGVCPLDDGREVVGDRPREQHVAVAPAMRRVAVEAQPSEQPLAADEREKCQRPDALPAEDAHERLLVACGGDVLDEDRLRVLGVRGPGRTPLRARAIAVGEPTRRAKAKHARLVGEQDRGAVGSGGLEQRVERRLEDLVERRCAGDGVGEAVDGVEVAQPRAQLLPLADIAGRPEHEAELAGLVVDRGAVHLEPRVAVARSAQPDRDGVDIGAARDLVPCLRGETRVVGMEQVDDPRPELGRFPAEVRPGGRGVDDRARQIAERDEIVRALDDEPADGVVDVLRSRARLGPAARCSAPQSALLLAAVCTICAERPGRNCHHRPDETSSSRRGPCSRCSWWRSCSPRPRPEPRSSRAAARPRASST